MSHSRLLARSEAGPPRLSAAWRKAVETLDHAFQPIVNVHSGATFGFEALLRGVSDAGFPTIQAVFDAAAAEDTLFAVEFALRAKAIAKFAAIPERGTAKLFLNVDNRVFDRPDYQSGLTESLLAASGLPTDAVCLEISERHALAGNGVFRKIIDQYKGRSVRIAIDDFGRGFSGLELLYECQPDFIKVDQYFIAGLAVDRRKRVFVAHMIALAHVLGIIVVAEGVETERDLYLCRDIGCDLIQGYFVQRPTQDIGALRESYDTVKTVIAGDRRDQRLRGDRLIAEHLDLLPTIPATADFADVFDAFRRHDRTPFLPVVADDGRPLGLVRERDLKEYVYSRFGRDLLANRAYRKSLADFIVRCPAVDMRSHISEFIDTYAYALGDEGLIVVEDQCYKGFLSTRALLGILAERKLAQAQDQNPLTRLSGNRVIYEYVSRCLADTGTPYSIAYFDFDFFKAFNDVYGFRQGDRALLLFAELLSKIEARQRCFVGHVGGDDFVAGFRSTQPAQATAIATRLAAKFRDDVTSFYSKEAREAGFLATTDRDGNCREVPLLRASIAIIHLPAGRRTLGEDELTDAIARCKATAKRSAEGLVEIVLPGPFPAEVPAVPSI